LLVANARVAIVRIISAVAVIGIAQTQTKPKSRAPESTTTETSTTEAATAAEPAAAMTSTAAATSKGRRGRSAQQESRRANDTEAIDAEQSDDCQAARQDIAIARSVVGHWFSRSLSCFTQTRFAYQKGRFESRFRSSHLDVIVVKLKRAAQMPALKHATIFAGFRLV
jgi:hypothetical protein